MKRYVCVHGHFYQPPRENPWLEAIELQDSAYPYHDWNVRIADECYRRNAASRILDEQKRITKIVNNYSRISFNFGPTLLSWLAAAAPETHAGIVEADRASRAMFGHGSALAQPYNHVIMPLASSRDQETQVMWGVRDFQYRFARAPVGMWLPETAVDLESLEVLARHGIQFTILSPYQAGRVRPLPENGDEGGNDEWEDVGDGIIDPSHAYLQRLPSGRSIALFFYDRNVSQAVAFEDILTRGEDFAERLANGFSEERDWPQLMHIATDGESYGHHHRHGDMALAYALEHVEREHIAELTNYTAYLEKYPPRFEAEIVENTAWSCAHGLGRWTEDCGCNTGTNPGWNQSWRKPLRESLDGLRDELAPVFEDLGGELFVDPWRARDEYIDVILDRSPGSVEAFLARHRRTDDGGRSDIERLELLEMQRHAMLMYTSCGWFFDDLAGIETVQVIQYAARALQLAEKLSGKSLEPEFTARLEAAKSNQPDQCDGRQIFDELVRTARLDPLRVGAHYAVSSLFEDYPEHTRIYCFQANRESLETRDVGTLRFAAGNATITSEITGEETPIGYAVAHLGEYNVAAGVRVGFSEDEAKEMLRDIDEAVRLADIPEIVRRIDAHFAGGTFSIRSLFRDEQRKILQRLLRDELDSIEAVYLDIHQRHASLGHLLHELRIPIPRVLRSADERAINHQLEQVLSARSLDVDRVDALLESAKLHDTELDETALEFCFRDTLEAIGERLERTPEDLAVLDELRLAIDVMEKLPFAINLWRLQNIYFAILQERVVENHSLLVPGSEADTWRKALLALGERLGIAV